MIRRLLNMLCRVTGRTCTVDRPATKDIRREMRERSSRLEASSVELRRQRHVIEAAFRGREKERHGL